MFLIAAAEKKSHPAAINRTRVESQSYHFNQLYLLYQCLITEYKLVIGSLSWSDRISQPKALLHILCIFVVCVYVAQNNQNSSPVVSGQ